MLQEPSLFTYTKCEIKGRFKQNVRLLIDFSLTVKAATFIFISGCGSAISSATEGQSCSNYNLVKN